ncbi:MAG: ABC transporter permease, partial [Verrucomicrobia bacterium]|nr:ABC transporter permease [Verrucomicrobiota bacterium]
MPDAPKALTRPDGWAIVQRNRPAMISLIFLVAIVVMAFVVPFFLPASLKGTSSDAFLPPLTRGFENPVLHLCGTDKNGQDLFYRLLTGAQVSLGVGIIGACISLVIGTLYGMISGYFGGRVDAFMMRAVDMLYAVPRILFIMIFIAAFDGVFKDWLDAARLWAQMAEWKSLEDVARYLIPYSKILVMIL